MNNAKYIRFFMFLVEKWGHLQIPVFSFRAGLWKKKPEKHPLHSSWC